VAAIGYFVVKRHDNATTTATTTAGVTGTAADTALAASINLRQTDLPSGWSRAPRPDSRCVPRGAGRCPGSGHASPGPVSGVHYDHDLGPVRRYGRARPVRLGHVAVVPEPSDPTVRMNSVTRVMTSDALAQSLATPFTNASFVACYTPTSRQWSRPRFPGPRPRSVGAAGRTDRCAVVRVPDHTHHPQPGSEVIGQAFMVGGRIESVLEPTTGGAPVPTDAFTPAYNAISGRVGLDAASRPPDPDVRLRLPHGSVVPCRGGDRSDRLGTLRAMAARAA